MSTTATREVATAYAPPRKTARLDDNDGDDDDAYSSCRSPDEASSSSSSDDDSDVFAHTTAAAATTTTCVNAIFAVTGPRAGVLHARSGHELLQSLQPHVDATVYRVLAQAWRHVAMPVEQYWGSRCYADVTTLTNTNTLTNTAAATAAGAGMTAAADMLHGTSRRVRAPDALRLASSFYGARSEAMAARAYARERGDVVIAIDRHYGNGSKRYNVLSRRVCDGEGKNDKATDDDNNSNNNSCSSALASFVAAIPRAHDRNVYVLIDEDAAVDPYFDIDCTYTYTDGDNNNNSNNNDADTTSTSHALPAWLPSAASSPAAVEADVEAMLLTVLQWAQAQLETRMRVTLQECVVLTSSVQVWQRTRDDNNDENGDKDAPAMRLREVKVSVHVHLRLSQQRAFASVVELHAFMSRLRSDCDRVLHDMDTSVTTTTTTMTTTTSDEEAMRQLHTARVVRHCVDFGVYTRWRALRLPYNVKSPFVAVDATATTTATTTRTVTDTTARHDALCDGAHLTAVDAAADDLLHAQLRACGVDTPCIDVGAVASSLLCCIVLSADAARQATQSALLRRLFYCFRFLLPVLPGHTRLRNAQLHDFLARYNALRDAHTSTGTPLSARDVSRLFDRACVQRDTTTATTGAATAGAALQLLYASVDVAVTRNKDAVDGVDDSLDVDDDDNSNNDNNNDSSDASSSLSPRAHTDPFALATPPRPRSVRVALHDMRHKQLLIEVFACLSPHYGACVEHNDYVVSPADAAAASSCDARPLYAEQLHVYYEEAIRAYYVMQKQSKFCLRLQRCHRSTFAQLYLTYGSIKVRCYSNDCCDERCVVVPWRSPSSSNHSSSDNVAQPQHASSSSSLDAVVTAVPGYPVYARLQQLHAQLFPPLSTEELVRRYGMSALRAA